MTPSKFPLPELLMPAGSKQKALTAFRYGADAVYCGVPMFSLRTRENNVTEQDILDILKYAKENGKKVYVTLNGFPHEFAIPSIIKHMQFLEEAKPDGIIFADLGVLALANEHSPSIPKHLSVQQSTVNIPAMKLWMQMGVERVILAREMAIKEVAKVHEALPDLELEYFVHGAVCMAYSGRCLLSNFTGGRDANRGACNHTCRWNYKVFDEEGREVDVSDHELEHPLDKGGRGDYESSYIQKNKMIYIPYNPDLKQKSQELRKNITPAEKKFWSMVLTIYPFDQYRFLRQKPLLKYIADFYCSELQLVVEIDGDSHVNQPEYDKKRTSDFLKYGIKVIRYTNEEIYSNIDGVWQDFEKKILERKEELSKQKQFPQPPLSRGKSIRDFEELKFWEEEQRKEQIIPVEEDFHGTHIMSSKDMCMIEELDKVWNAGVCSLKVEGRNKTAYYAATIARAYRKALDNLHDGKEFDEKLWEEIHATANRGFFPGFLNGKPRNGDDIKYSANSSTAKKEFCGVVEKYEDGRVFVTIKNRIDEGNNLEVVMPKMEEDFSFIATDLMFGGEKVSSLHGGDLNKIASFACEKEIPVGVFLRQIAQNPGIKMTPTQEASKSYKA